MKNATSNYFDIVPTNVSNILAVVSKGNGSVMLQYRISPQATTVQNMELAIDLIEVFTDYCQTVQRDTY